MIKLKWANRTQVEDREVSLLEHIAELRKRLIIILSILAITSFVCYFFFDPILRIILYPLGLTKLNVLSLVEIFMVRFKVALWAAFFITFPIITYQVLAFVARGLTPKEKKYVIVSTFLMFFLFISGAVFCYFIILPVGVAWLKSQSGGSLNLLLTADKNMSFVMGFVLGVGASFETPLVIWLLAKLNIVKWRQLIKQWRIAVIIIVIAASIITPDWNPVNTMLVSLPMIVLYGLGIILAKYF